jgi:aldehyde dehydrogenase (NAD+)
MTIKEIVSRQREYFYTDATKSIDFRVAALKSLQSAIIQDEGKILEALRKDLNKSDFEGYMTEVGIVLDELRFCLKHIRGWAKTKTVRTPLAQFHAKSFIVPEPYGVALVLAPWNYPFQLCVGPLIGAISAGNCAVIKPSAYAPNTSHMLAEIIASCFPPEYITVVEGGREENTKLLKQKFDYIFFTGSVEVGKVVMEAASKNLTPVTLELGGKSPCIVDQTADLKCAAKRIAFGKYLNAGQTCVAPDYLLVHQSVKDELIAHIKTMVKEFFPNGEYADMPVIINDKHFNRLLGLMKGEKVLLGGDYDPKTRFIEPTILGDITFDSPIMQEEIFGPILPVLTFDTMDQVISSVNARPKPLALYLFTSDKATEHRVLKSISFGGGCINDTMIHLATPRMGFGGVGDSGMGSYHGKLSFDTFTHYKSIVKKYTWFDMPIRYHPYTKSCFKLIRLLLK